MVFDKFVWYAVFAKLTANFVYCCDNISISMYIMCVILCLLSALSRRVGALQIYASDIETIKKIPLLLFYFCNYYYYLLDAVNLPPTKILS